MKYLRVLPLAAACGAVVLSVATPASAARPTSAQRAGTAPAASASGPGIREFIRTVGGKVIRNQDALSLFRAWMMRQHGFARSGYVGSIDHLARKATTIMWAGRPTPLLTSILSEGRRRGIAVTIQHRKYSLRQLRAAISAIWGQAARGGWSGFKISDIAAVAARYDGLTVNGTYTSVPAARRAPQVRSLATVVKGVPVRVAPGIRVDQATGRDNDFAPFDAGGYMMSDSNNGDTCTSGFAITINGIPHITTARHCTAGDYRDRSASNPYGTSVTTSGDGGGRVLSEPGIRQAWDGAFNSQNFFKDVIGYEDLAVNDLVCTGGGNSGEHCAVQVRNLLVSDNDGFGAFSTIEGLQTDTRTGFIAAMQGDSGGPVISLTNTSNGQVRAAGMIQAITGNMMIGTTDCGSAFDYSTGLFNGNPLACSKTVLFSSMRTIVNTIPGAQLVD